ncbi:DnaB-like helicase N-terminal domain-containing protein, partial [Oleiphilus sp. HI0132]|uniref:DnaB-like helicase N-terminal domain-containing protein n=1 Tax=Oleiphilus sp. HI0132 TaxID=1822270 RepID=UPI0018D3BC28
MKKLFENNIQKFNSLESEQYLIGAMLQHLVDDYELPNYLSIELYSLNKHVLIVEAIDWVLKSGMEFSVSEVVNILKINDKLSYIGGETYLNA